ncbi:MAG: FMN-binding protein [Velocimicrobium sp.]
MMLGIIAAVLYVLAASNLWIKKISNTNLHKPLTIMHKAIGIVFLGIIISHIIITWGLMKQRPTSMYVIGYFMTLCAIILVLSYLFRKKLGKNWIVIHRIFAVLVLACLILHVYIGFSSLAEYKKSVNQISVSNVDLSRIEDGNYIGKCNVGYIYARVEVIVKDSNIQQISILEHRTERGKPAETIVNDIVNQQQVQVDAITGATNSSKVIMKAVENALRNERE